MKTTKIRIDITENDVTRIEEIDAFKVNALFAVHRTIGAKGWTITHIRSGFAFGTQIRRKVDALRIARAAGNDPDWNRVMMRDGASYDPSMRDAALRWVTWLRQVSDRSYYVSGT